VSVRIYTESSIWLVSCTPGVMATAAIQAPDHRLRQQQAPKPGKKYLGFRSIKNATPSQHEDQELDFSNVLPPVEITETAEHLRILIPLDGIDARHVYVFATARSISIEVRMKHSIIRPGGIYEEVQYQRLTRELKLHQAIRQGLNNLRVMCDNLEITCRKAFTSDDTTWSELLQMDTRGSLGCVPMQVSSRQPGRLSASFAES